VIAFDPVPSLSEGGHVRVVAPASPFPLDRFERGVARLATRYRVTFDEGLFARNAYLAGDDHRRLRELERAIDDPDVDAIVAARGGYGTMRVIDRITPERVRAAKKLLVGFSDLTALHALWARAGLRSVHASMTTGVGDMDDAAFDRWRTIVEGGVPAKLERLETIAPGRARGPLIGGNLALMAALHGTPYAPPIDGAILFIEEITEAPYRIDRMLTSLRLSGWLARAAGVAVGRFTACDPREDGRTALEVVGERLHDLGLPVVGAIPAGHVDDNLELPLGAAVEIDGDVGTLTFLEPATA
jgi:muramoyltetrapeptide carboxypeptidase